MRKKLVVRVGAVVTVLVVALFTVLPDLVNAEGEGSQEPTGEVVAEVPVETPDEVLVETPVEQPVEKPKEEPSVEQPVEKPVEPSTGEQGAEIPVEQPEEVVIETPQEVQIEVQRGEPQVNVTDTGDSTVTTTEPSVAGSQNTAENTTVEVINASADKGSLENEENVVVIERAEKEVPEKENDKPDKNTKEPVIQKSQVNTSTVRAAAPSTSTTTAGTVTQGTNSHVKDETPKTGVEDYSIYFLLGAVMLLGVAFCAYSKKLSYEE